MAGWQDAPVVEKSAWESAPVVKAKPKPKAAPKKPAEKSFLRQSVDNLGMQIGGFAKSVAGLIDVPIQGAAGAVGLLELGKGRAQEGILRIMGAGKAADDARRVTDYKTRQYTNVPTLRGAIESISPTPTDSTGRFAHAATEALGGVAGGLGLAKLIGGAAGPVAQRVSKVMQSSRGTQAVGATTGALSSEAARQAGASTPVQIAAGLGGGLAGGLAVSGGKRLVGAMTGRPAQQPVLDEARQAGVRVMTSDVKPPKTFIGKNTMALGERIPIVGTGGPRASQQAERIAAVKSFVRDYGGDDVVDVFDASPSALNDVTENLAKTRGAALTTLSNQKNTVIDKFAAPVPIPTATAYIDKKITELQRINPEKLGPVIAELESWKRTLAGKTLREIEENRKILGAAFDDPSLASIRTIGKKAISDLYGPLRSDMGEFIKRSGGQADFTRWKTANDRLAAMSGELGDAAFKSVLRKADATPENVAKLLFSKKPSDVGRLYANLDQAGRARAQAAILQRAYDRAISADGGLSAERFTRNIEALGASVGVMFKGDDLARLKGLTRVLEVTRRAAESSAMPPTGVQNAPVAWGYTLGALFGQAALPIAAVGGLFARAYESAPVRNILLNLAKSKKGSQQEALLISRLATEVQKVGAVRSMNMGALNDNVGVRAAAGNAEEDQQE
jgi:hypothetical protein